MAEVKNEEITAALLLLAAEDSQASEDARAALDWICGEEGLTLITQERIQDFCWRELPDNWMSLQEDYERVVQSLGRVLDLLGLPRYAGICRSETTLAILGAYADSRRKGLAAYRKASTASGICRRMCPNSHGVRRRAGRRPPPGPGPRSSWNSPWPAASWSPGSGDGRPGRPNSSAST
jgi:hypothetical protein